MLSAAASRGASCFVNRKLHRAVSQLHVLSWSADGLKARTTVTRAASPFRRHCSAFRAAAATQGMGATPVRDAMHDKLTSQLRPSRLEILDESSKHAGHAAMKGLSGGESHFRVAVVSDQFEGLSTIKRHKLVYQVLAEELAGPVHALSVNTKTPSEDSQQ